MTHSKLEALLRPIVQEYGLGTVLKFLGEIADTRRDGGQLETLRDGVANGSRRAKPKVTAPEYVEKMGLPSEKSAAVSELAMRFEQKSFLPSFGNITTFCQTYGIEVPASKSRASAIPRVFKFIAQMESHEVHRILDDGLFSGPSRLRPIADAIDNFDRSASRWPPRMPPNRRTPAAEEPRPAELDPNGPAQEPLNRTQTGQPSYTG